MYQVFIIPFCPLKHTIMYNYFKKVIYLLGSKSLKRQVALRLGHISVQLSRLDLHEVQQRAETVRVTLHFEEHDALLAEGAAHQGQ